MMFIRDEIPADFAARETLLDAAFGGDRYAKTSERLREGRLPAEGLSLVAEDGGALTGTVRLWNIEAGAGCPALLLGPLAVAPQRQSGGLGAALMRVALARAAELGHGAVLLVGDAPYYGRFGFCAAATGRLRLPGPWDPARLLARELQPDALAGAAGMIAATGVFDPALAVAQAA